MNLNLNSYRILEKLRDEENTKIERFDTKRVTLMDVGLNVESDLDAGIKVAEAALAGLGKININDKIHVSIEKLPAVATLCSQLAGWHIKIDGKTALGSGPVRILAKKPRGMIEKIGYSETSNKGVLILETPLPPDRETCRKILHEAEIEDLIIAVFRENSITGLINILSRIVEVGIFRLFNLGYDVNKILYAEGTVPMLGLSDNVMFEANDAIIYRGSVELEVNGWDPGLTDKAISRYSRAYGRPFREILREAEGNFYKIPVDVFAPAELRVTDLRDNRVYSSMG